MKPLYYSALAPPQVASALAFQANESLRPVIAYLNAAKAAAKEREVRSRVQWTAVPVERTIQLRASDSLLEIAGEGGSYEVVGWSGAGQEIVDVAVAPAREAGEVFEDDGTAAQKIVEFLDGLKVL